jgi:tRNA(Ile)-lysidine synthase
MNLVLDLALLSPHRRYLLALSGGRDSVALLHLLLENGFEKLHLVHLDHQLRGSESDGDAEFVAALAQSKQLPLTLAQADLTGTSDSLETAARNARQALFAKVARERDCSRVLLAHHADDQAETCLFNLLRGSSGIKGMAREHEIQVGDQTLTLLRPLLQTRRSEIDRYLLEKGIDYREDSSNQDPAHTRNRLRHEALPLLADILKRDLAPALVRAAEISREKEEIIGSLLDTLELRDPQGRLFLPKVRELAPALQKASLQQYLIENEVPNLSKSLMERALLLVSPDGPPSLNLPGNRFLRRKEARILIT